MRAIPVSIRIGPMCAKFCCGPTVMTKKGGTDRQTDKGTLQLCIVDTGKCSQYNKLVIAKIVPFLICEITSQKSILKNSLYERTLSNTRSNICGAYLVMKECVCLGGGIMWPQFSNRIQNNIIAH